MLKTPDKTTLLFKWYINISLSCCLGLFLPQICLADETSDLEKKQLESEGALIGNIHYQIGDVFDLSNPKENNFVFRFFNFLHFKTRQFVLEDQLLFKTGEPFSARLIEETERNIRSNRYIYDAWITPKSYQDGKVDIEVKTQDTWTLSFGARYDNVGGESDSSVFIEERNLFGLGTRLTLASSSDVDREENRISYNDNNLTGRHIVFGFDYSNNSDGHFRAFELQRPFYAFDVKHAYGTKLSSEILTEKIYSEGVITDQYQHEISEASLSYGFSQGLVRNRTLRWQMSINYNENKFRELDDGILTNPFPSDNKLIYPSIGANYIQNKYIKTQNFRHILRTEDVNMGRDFAGSIGWASTAWGSDENGIILNASFSDANHLSNNRIVLWNLSGTGRGVSGGFENVSAYANAIYHAPNFENQAFHADFTFQLLHKPDDNNQLQLGGDNGLSGYPIRVQSGDRSILFNLEQRYYTDWHLLQLIHVGGSLFFNTGSAWTPGDANQAFKLLSDVGFGLRLESSRSESGRTLHLDLAFPLNSEGGEDKWQFNVTTSGEF